MVSSESGTALCPHCGAEIHCSACGANLATERKSTLYNLPLIGETVDLGRTFWRVTRAPITEPVRIAGLPGGSPYKILITGLGMFIGFFLTVEAVARAWGNPGFTQEQDQFLNSAKYSILLNIVIAAAVVYVASALIAGRKVSAGSHARLWALLWGYYLTVEGALLIAVVIVYSFVYFELRSFEPAVLKFMNAVLLPAVVGILLLMLLNLVATHARQWARPIWLSAAIFALALAITHWSVPLIITPLGNLVRKTGMQVLF